MSRTGAQLKAQIDSEPNHPWNGLAFPLNDDGTVYNPHIYKVVLYRQSDTRLIVHRDKFRTLAAKVKDKIGTVSDVGLMRVFIRYHADDFVDEDVSGAESSSDEYVEFYQDLTRSQVLAYLSAQGITINDLTIKQVRDKIEDVRL